MNVTTEELERAAYDRWHTRSTRTAKRIVKSHDAAEWLVAALCCALAAVYGVLITWR